MSDIRPTPDIAAELRRLNTEREKLLGGQPISGDVRIPRPYSGVGGDVPEDGE